MRELLPYLINGISVGGQYALIAIGYTLVYGILRLINFAHGDVFMVAGLVMVYATTALPFYVALPLVLVVTVLLGFTIERVAYKPLPMESRMVLGLMPWSSNSSGLSWEWVVVAGWMTRDFTSATFAKREKISRLSMNLWASAWPPLISKVKMDAPPLGKYFSYRAWSGWSGREGWLTCST